MKFKMLWDILPGSVEKALNEWFDSNPDAISWVVPGRVHDAPLVSENNGPNGLEEGLNRENGK